MSFHEFSSCLGYHHGPFMAFHFQMGCLEIAGSPGVACRVAGCLALAEDLAAAVAAVDSDRPRGWVVGKDRYPTNGQHMATCHRKPQNKGNLWIFMVICPDEIFWRFEHQGDWTFVS